MYENRRHDKKRFWGKKNVYNWFLEQRGKTRPDQGDKVCRLSRWRVSCRWLSLSTFSWKTQLDGLTYWRRPRGLADGPIKIRRWVSWKAPACHQNVRQMAATRRTSCAVAHPETRPKSLENIYSLKRNRKNDNKTKKKTRPRSRSGPTPISSRFSLIVWYWQRNEKKDVNLVSRDRNLRMVVFFEKSSVSGILIEKTHENHSMNHITGTNLWKRG